jgi:hypothetical protein
MTNQSRWQVNEVRIFIAKRYIAVAISVRTWINHQMEREA